MTLRILLHRQKRPMKGFWKKSVFITRMDYWANCKKEIARIIKPQGKAVCFGWNSNGIGKGKRFSHGTVSYRKSWRIKKRYVSDCGNEIGGKQ